MRLLAEIVLVVIAGAGAVICVALLRDWPPTRSRARRPPEPSPPEQLVRLERLVIMAQSSALHVHAYLRPLLADIASRRLAAQGHSLERMPEDAGRRVLGDRLWEIVRPDRPFPKDRYARGVSAQDLAAMLEVLERL